MKRKRTPQSSFISSKGIFAAVTIVLLFLAVRPVIAQQKAPWVSPKTAQELKNPLAGDKAALMEAKKLYTTNCAPCHGDKGKGDGPAAQALNPKPADHSSATIQSESDGSLFWKLSEGRNPMPAYKNVFNEQQRWALVSYIRTLAKPKK